MAKEEIGFKHGVPENPDRTWEKRINGHTFTFKKTREKNGFFLYGCQCRSEDDRFTSSSATSFYSGQDLTPEEVEQASQFSAFIQGYQPVAALRASIKR